MSARIDPDSRPWSPEAEQSVLGGLLLDNRAFDRVGDVLHAHHFFDSRHAAIWTAIAGAIAASMPADVITVFQALEEAGKADGCGLPYLNALAQSVPSAANISRYAEIVRERAAQRNLLATADEALAIAAEPGDVGGKVDRITTMFGEIQRQQVRKAPRAISEIALERISHYTALEEGTTSAGWPTHIRGLDYRLNGGLRAGSFYVLAARPSVGKSSFAQSIGMTLAEAGMRTLFLSLESC